MSNYQGDPNVRRVLEEHEAQETAGEMADRLGRPEYPETCPKCGGSEWKLINPPICTGCGWRPVDRYRPEEP